MKVIKMKILIIEDEYSLADAIRESLEKEHLDVTIVTNGQDGEDEALTGMQCLRFVTDDNRNNCRR